MGILDGISVVEVAAAQFGPEACMILADLGADVIKIEPKQGEFTRPVLKDYEAKGVNAYFLAHNRNKRGMAIDYKSAKGREVIYKLVEKADVFVTTYAPGAPERHGYSYEELSKINPRLIYCRGTGFGERGPMKDWPANDILAQAWSGIMHQNGDGSFPMGTAVVDECGAVALALGAVGALYARERTGKGQKVSVSLLQIGIYLLAMEYVSYLLSGREPPQSGRGHSMVKGLWRSFPTKDKPIVMGGVQDEPWAELCRVLGLEELIDDPRFATADSRAENLEEVTSILEKVLVGKRAEEWLPLLRDIGVRAAPTLSLSEVMEHPVAGEQIKANEYFTSVKAHDDEVQVTAPIIQFSDTPSIVRTQSFDVGEHNAEIMLELGYSWDEIAQMIREEII
jgi:crotonobetainyl-CoA:carnitine CoA-transferase CaiB-like acyl-CoA transferase